MKILRLKKLFIKYKEKFKSNNSFLKNKDILWKYMVAIVFISILFVVSIITIYSSLQTLNHNIEELNKQGKISTEFEKFGKIIFQKNVIGAEYLFYKGKNKELISVFANNTEEIDGLINLLKKDIDSEQQLKLLDIIDDINYETHKIFIDKIVPMSEKGLNPMFMTVLYNDMSSRTEELIITLNQAQKLADKFKTEARIETQENIKFTLNIIRSSTIFSIMMGILLIYIISRGIKINLQKVIEVSDQIAEKNLVVDKLNYQGNDEIARLSASVNVMIDNLKNIIQRVVSSAAINFVTSEKIVNSSGEISASIQEVAASSEELFEVTDKMKESVEDINTVVDGVNNLTKDGVDRMETTQKKMSQILVNSKKSNEIIRSLNQSTEEIENIASVISQISEQTNLLALNAAIEAARAGEHGRGFAVVADEIRTLSVETQKSVSNIHNIISKLISETNGVVDNIEDNNQRIEEGALSLNQTEKIFNDIAIGIEEFTDQIKYIGSFRNEISTSSSEVQRATGEQFNLMQDISASASELSNISQELNDLINQFNLE